MIIHYGKDTQYPHGFEYKENGEVNEFRKDKI